MTFYQHVGFEVLIGFAIGEVIPSVLKECSALVFRGRAVQEEQPT
jgi:hypothetical protein